MATAWSPALPAMHSSLTPQRAPSRIQQHSAGCSRLSSSFIASCSVASFSSSSFAGLALRPSVSRLPTQKRGGLVLVRAKVALGCTKRSRSRKSVARVSGFRIRMSTPGGRNAIRRRRAKGRKRLVPATNPNSGKYA